MATRTKPLISAAALASVAAVAVATPSIAPNLTQPTPSALSRAAYELTTFSDVLSIPGNVWTDVLFCGNVGCNAQWGGTLGPDSYGPEWAKPQGDSVTGEVAYVNPWAQYCANTCFQSGIPGVAYMFADALINGNGQGYDDYENWRVGLVNYFFEPNTTFTIGGGTSPNLQYVTEGFSAASWYILQGTIGQAVPALTLPIAAAYWGPTNLSVVYNLALTAVAGVANAVPGVGPFIGNSILAYLGNLEIPGTTGGQFYGYGLSGTLNYWLDIANGSAPFPTATPSVTPPAAALKVAAPAEATVVSATDTVSADASDTGAASGDTKAESQESATESVSDDAKPEAVSVDATETVADAATETVTDAGTPKVTPAPEERVTAVAVTAAAKPAPKRPLRDAVEKVSKQVTAAIDGAKAKAAERAAARSAAAKDRLAKAAAGSK